MHYKKIIFISYLAFISINSAFIQPVQSIPSIKAAEHIRLKNGIFNRTISIRSLENLTMTGKPKGTLNNLLIFSNQSPKELAQLLKQEYNLDLVTTSKLMYSSIGEVIMLPKGM